MKRLLLILALIFIPLNAHAVIGVNYTGNEVLKVADTEEYLPNSDIHGGIGGRNEHQFVQEKAFEFTVDALYDVNYLSINALGIPNSTDGINYMNLGPSQSMDVNFSIIKGSNLFETAAHVIAPMPDPNGTIASTSYTFTTDNSYYSTEYKNLLLPLNAQLEPNETYWISAADPRFSGMTLSYSTDFVTNTVPEPATIFLLGTGLLGILFRRKYIIS